MIRSYSWPGNVRELENVLERALILTPGTDLVPEDLALPCARPVRPVTTPGDEDAERDAAARDRTHGRIGSLSIKTNTKDLEERLIREALQQTAGNRTRAARLLELSARALQYKIKEYQIDALHPLSIVLDNSRVQDTSSKGKPNANPLSPLERLRRDR
jgi:two-component system response regulator AtoC